MKKYVLLSFFIIFFLLFNPNVYASEKREAVNETIEFYYRYSYKIYNSNEYTEYTNSTIFLDILYVEKNNLITYRNLSRFKDVDKISISFKEPLDQDIEIKGLLISDNKNKIDIKIFKNTKQVTIDIPKDTYSSIELNFASDDYPRVFQISNIELLTPHGDIYTNENVGVYIFTDEPNIEYYSFDNGKTYDNFYYNYYDKNSEGELIIKNTCWFKSLPKKFKITGIDKEIPKLEIKATKKDSKKQATSGMWSSEGINYSFNLISSGFSKADIYYCQDTSNTCIPETKYNNKIITKYNILNGSYFIRYRAVSNSMAMSKIYSFNAKVDSNPSIIEVKAISNDKVINNNEWSNKDVIFSFVKTKGASSPAIYYCIDNDNKCIPNEVIKENQIVDKYKQLRGIYYIRYYSINEASIKSSINSYTIKVDDSNKTCISKRVGYKFNKV